MLIQVISLVGAALVLTAFAALQTRRMSAETYAYQLMNLFGGFFLFLAAMTARQAGLIAIEAAWTLVSGYGLFRVWRAARL